MLYNLGIKITHAQFKIVEHLLPIQRGNVSLPTLTVLNAILYIAEHGCNGEVFQLISAIIYTRTNRWAKQGVLDVVFAVLQEADVINIRVDTIHLDSTAVKVHPDGTGALKKRYTIYWQI